MGVCLEMWGYMRSLMIWRPFFQLSYEQAHALEKLISHCGTGFWYVWGFADTWLIILSSCWYLHFSELWTCRIYSRRVKRSKCPTMLLPHTVYFWDTLGPDRTISCRMQNRMVWIKEVNVWRPLCDLLHGDMFLWVKSGIKTLKD